MGWEDSATKTGEATVLDLCNQCVGVGPEPVTDRLELYPLLFSIAPDDDTWTSLTRWVGHGPAFHCLDNTRNRRMNCSAGLALADSLTLEHRLTGSDEGFRYITSVLQQWDDQ
jgi:hypothetical protein